MRSTTPCRAICPLSSSLACSFCDRSAAAIARGSGEYAARFRRLHRVACARLFPGACAPRHPAGQFALFHLPWRAHSVIGLLRQSRGFRENTPLAFAAFIAWPALVYFLAHALHDRVQGNWPSFIFPALILLAASVIVQQRGQDHGGSLVRTSIALTIPVVAAILLVSYAQAFLGLIPMGNSDPLARMTAIGFRPVAERIAATARKDDAGAIATSKYALTGWAGLYPA